MSRLSRFIVGIVCTVALALAPWAGSTHASAPAPDDRARQILIQRQARHRTQADEEVGELTVIARNGTVRRKQWKSYRQGWGATTNRLIRFLSPPDVRGVGYLLRQRPGKAPDEWLYLPSMKRERRIVSSDRESAFVGTDFTYEDLEEFDEANYDLTLLADHVADGQASYVIEAKPRRPSAYEKKILRIRRDDLCLLNVEYFRAADRGLSKRLTIGDYQDVSGHQVALRYEMSDITKGSRTVVVLHDVIINRPQPQDRYTIENLLREDDDIGRGLGFASPRALARSIQGAGDSATLRPPAARLDHQITGYVESRSFLHFDTDGGRGRAVEEWGAAFFRYAARAGPARIRAAVRAELNSAGVLGPVIFDPADRSRRRSPLSLRELSVLIPIAHGVDFQAGRFSVSWAQTDGYSPTDAFLPRDFADPLTEDRLPLWASRVRGERGGLRFDVMAAATTTPWRLPPLNGRDSPLTSAKLFLIDEASSVPTRGFQAARVGGTIGRWDVAVWERSGVRPCPVIEPKQDLAQTTEEGEFIPIGRRYATERALGAQISRDYRGWLIQGELAMLHSEDPAVGNAALWTIGGQRTVGETVFTGTVAINSIATPTDPLLLFDRALLPSFIMNLRQNETWGRWSVGWLGTFDRVGGVLMMDAVKDLREAVKLTGGADLPHGAQLSPARAFAGGKRLRLGLRWDW